MPLSSESLILNETTLFYLNLSTTATNSSNSFNKIKDWTSHVSKTSHSTKPSSVHMASAKSSTLVPTKRTTSSSSAIVVAKTHDAQPKTKKVKLENYNLATVEFLGEDEAVEREAALSSPIKGNQ